MGAQVLGIMFLVGVTVVSLATNANAGIWDAINKANQAVSTVENAKNTASRAGALVPKSSGAKRQPRSQEPEPEPEREPAGTLTDKSRASIQKAKRAWVAAFKAQDWDALVDQYAEDAIALPPDDLAISGRDAIREYFNDDAQTSDEVFETVEIGGVESVAYARGNFSFTITSEGSEPVAVSGKYIEIWEKQDDGNWLITHDIWNSNPAN